MMKFTRQAAIDSLIMVMAIGCGSWAGAKIFNFSTWECYNNVMDYYAVNLEVKECLYRPEGTLRRIVLSTVLSAPILILITQGIILAMFGSSSRAVRVVGVLGGLLGSVTNSLQLAGMFYERSFPCQVESPSPTSRFHKDRRSYECYVNGEEGITTIIYLELMLMIAMVVYSVYRLTNRDRENNKETGGQSVGSSRGCWRRRGKMSGPGAGVESGDVKTKAGQAAVYRHQDTGGEEGQDRIPLRFLDNLFQDHQKEGVVTYDKFGRLMNCLVLPLKEQGLNVPASTDYRTIFKKYDTRGDGKLAVDEWKKLASEEVYKNLI